MIQGGLDRYQNNFTQGTKIAEMSKQCRSARPGSKRQELGCGAESRSIPAQSKQPAQNDGPPCRAIQSTYL